MSTRHRLAPTCAALGLLVPGCTTTTLQDVDALARATDARTVVLEEDLSLYSPFDALVTREFLELIRAQRAEVFALFGVHSDEPTVVQLHPNEGLDIAITAVGDKLRFDGISSSPHGGNLGRAYRNVVVVEVAPPRTIELDDGRALSTTPSASMYRDTIRHELTHVATDLLDVRGADWLTEGIAHLVQWIPIENGRLVLDPLPPQLRGAAAEPRELRSIDRLVDWEQSFPPVEIDVPMRRLSLSLVTFLIDRLGGDVRAGLAQIAAWPPERVRAEELEWSAWLDGLASP